MSSVLACFLFSFRCFSSQFTQPSPLQNLPCSGWPAALQSRGEGLSATASRSPPALVCRLGRSATPRRAVPSGEPPPRQRPRAGSGVRRSCRLPATRPGDTRTGCRAPLAAAFRAFLSFGDLHKGCHSASETGIELQRLAALAAMSPVLW